jgi:hypothetical protein
LKLHVHVISRGAKGEKEKDTGRKRGTVNEIETPNN